MKILTTIKEGFKKVGKFFDKNLINPISRLIQGIKNGFNKSGKKMESWLSKSSTLLFISLFLSVIIFIVIDQKMVTFSQSSAEVLKSRPVTAVYNKEVYVVEGLPETVDITLIGGKTDLFIAKQMPSYDIQIDLTGLKPGTHKVNIKYNASISNLDYMVNPSTATVVIYDKVSQTRTVGFDLLNKDSIDSKLVIDEATIDTDLVVIKGAEYKLKKVATVKALIDVKNLLKQEVGVQTIKDVPLKAYDDKGNVIDVEIVPGTVTASLKISSPNKELPIKVFTTGKVAFGEAINTINLSTTKVIVYGTTEILKGLSYLPITINVEGIKTSTSFKVELEKPIGVTYISVTSLTVDISLDAEATKDFEQVRVDIKNLKDGYSVNASSSNDEYVTVNVKGVEAILNSITNDNIKAFVDLNGLTEGTHEVDVQVEGTDARLSYTAKTKKITVIIKKK